MTLAASMFLGLDIGTSAVKALLVDDAERARHSFHHELAYAVSQGLLGSVDANRGDPHNGWDTDALRAGLDPQPRSGGQERLENAVARVATLR